MRLALRRRRVFVVFSVIDYLRCVALQRPVFPFLFIANAARGAIHADMKLENYWGRGARKIAEYNLIALRWAFPGRLSLR